MRWRGQRRELTGLTIFCSISSLLRKEGEDRELGLGQEWVQGKEGGKRKEGDREEERPRGKQKVTDSLLGTNCYSQEADCALVLSITRGFLFTCEF